MIYTHFVFFVPIYLFIGFPFETPVLINVSPTYIRRPVGVWGSKFDSVRFEKRSEAKRERSEAKSEAKRKPSEAKRKRKRSEKRSVAQQSD